MYMENNVLTYVVVSYNDQSEYSEPNYFEMAEAAMEILLVTNDAEKAYKAAEERRKVYDAFAKEEETDHYGDDYIDPRSVAIQGWRNNTKVFEMVVEPLKNNGQIDEDDIPEFIGEILDGFEDFLVEKGVEIPNPERNEAIAFGGDPDGIAILYGSDYGELYDYIEETLKNWGVVKEA